MFEFGSRIRTTEPFIQPLTAPTLLPSIPASFHPHCSYDLFVKDFVTPNAAQIPCSSVDIYISFTRSYTTYTPPPLLAQFMALSYTLR
jgi:hypothetical protein